MLRAQLSLRHRQWLKEVLVEKVTQWHIRNLPNNMSQKVVVTIGIGTFCIRRKVEGMLIEQFDNLLKGVIAVEIF